MVIATFGCQTTQGAKHDPTATPVSVASTPNITSTTNPPRVNPPAINVLAPPVAVSQSQEAPAEGASESGWVKTKTEPAKPSSALADLDPDNDGEVAPPEELPGCLEELARLGARFTSADIAFSQKRDQVFTCGATQVVVYKGRENAPKYNSSPRLTCRMALGLIRFEELASQLSKKYFDAGVQRIEQGGTYSCRKMARFADLVSEHSYANAIDVRSVRLSNGKTISVKGHFGDIGSEPATKESKFLRELASRLYDDAVFSVVLTPFFDRLHHDHFHFDQARYRVDGTR